MVREEKVKNKEKKFKMSKCFTSVCSTDKLKIGNKSNMAVKYVG